MVEAGKRLKEAGAAYLAIPCVTAHYFYRELCRQIDLPIISLLEKTADYFRTEGVDEVAILATSGTVMSKIIQQELGKNISRRCCLMKDSNRKSWRLSISRLRPDDR